MAAAETTTTSQDDQSSSPAQRRSCWHLPRLIVIFIVFSLLSPYFATPENIVGILLATAVNGVLALGVTFIIITAGIDLSVGTVMTLVGRDDRPGGHDLWAADAWWVSSSAYSPARPPGLSTA